MSDYVPPKKIDKEEVVVRARSVRIASKRLDGTRISRSEEKARNQKNSCLTIIEHQITSNWQSLLKSGVKVPNRRILQLQWTMNSASQMDVKERGSLYMD